MIERILLALDDSPDSLAASRVAIDLATGGSARIRAVHVLADHALDLLIRAPGEQDAGRRRGRAAVAVLERLRERAVSVGIPVETDVLSGDIAPAVLDDARRWHADLIVMGKSARSAAGEPYVGAHTRHVLEFAEQPVLVVPPSG